MTTELKDGKLAVYAKNRTEWRTWLTENRQVEKSVWLILYHKKSKVESISLIEATEEALCFGWIDSLCKKRDLESYYLTYSPRKSKSKWSKINKDRVENLIEQGIMTQAVQNAINTAKENGRWDEN